MPKNQSLTIYELDANGIQNMHGVYLIVSIFIQSNKMPFENWENMDKQIFIESPFQLKVSIPINSGF